MKLRLKKGVPLHKGRGLHPMMQFGHYYRPNFSARYRIGYEAVEIPDNHAKGLLIVHSDILEVAPKDDSVSRKKWTAKISRLKRGELMKVASALGIDNAEYMKMKNEKLRETLLTYIDKLDEAFEVLNK